MRTKLFGTQSALSVAREIAVVLIASTGLILGLYLRISAFAPPLFLIPATLMAHEFWLAVGTSLYSTD
jgi:hypothetical protein